MLTLLGEDDAAAKAHAATVLELETALAKASKSRVDLRDPIANYHKFAVADIIRDYPGRARSAPTWTPRTGRACRTWSSASRSSSSALQGLLTERPLADWKVYLRWHLLRTTAPYLHAAAEDEAFAFYGKVLREQQQQEPRWQRAAKVIDGEIGEALGQLFVEQVFPARRPRAHVGTGG